MTRPRADVLQEYQDFYAELLRLNPSQRERLEAQDAPEQRCRWRVELDCGCITEALTYGKEHPPTDGPWIQVLADDRMGHASGKTFVIDAGSRSLGMTPGFLWCSGHGLQTLPWREITRWVERRERYSSRTGDLFASWTVLLSCGHACAILVTDLDWRPEHGHRPNPRMAEVAQRLLAKHDLSDDSRLWFEPRLAGGWPEPQTGEECADCAYRRRIISYAPIGPLTWPGDCERPSPAALTRRLRAAEARVNALREELVLAETAATELRTKRDRSDTQ